MAPPALPEGVTAADDDPLALSSRCWTVAPDGAPYVPIRNRGDISGRMVGVVKPGMVVEFEELDGRGPVTLRDFQQSWSYMKIWKLGADGKRAAGGWVPVGTWEKPHFLPCSAKGQMVDWKNFVRSGGGEEEDAAAAEVSPEEQMNSNRRLEFPLPPLPEGAADHLLSLRRGARERKLGRHFAREGGKPYERVIVAGLPGLGSEGFISVAVWISKFFAVEVVRRNVGAFFGHFLWNPFRCPVDEDTLVVFVVQDPWAWSSHVARGSWEEKFGPIQRKPCDEGQFEFLEHSDVDFNLDTLLHTPLHIESLVFPDGIMGCWAGMVHAAFELAACNRNAIILEHEDFLFRTAELATLFDDLGIRRVPKKLAVTHTGQLELIRSYAAELEPRCAAPFADKLGSLCSLLDYDVGGPFAKWSPYVLRELALPHLGKYRSFDPEGSDAKQALEFLAAHGYVVFRQVADKDEVKLGEQLFWEFVWGCDPSIQPEDPKTWCSLPKGAQLGWPAESGTGIISSRGIGQSALLWHIRGLPRLRRAFSLVFGTEELITSFDGASVFRPYGHDPSWRSKGPWYHVDQGGLMHSGFRSVQGLVTLTEVSAETGGFVCVPGSHLFHDTFLARPENHADGRIIIGSEDPLLGQWSQEHGSGPILVPLRAGDAVLWDSRTVHCSTHPLYEPPDSVLNGNRMLRIAAYVSMAPAAWATKGTLLERSRIFPEGSDRPTKNFTSTHLAHHLHIVDEGPMGNTIAPQLSDEQLLLARGDESSKCPLEVGSPSFLPPKQYRCMANSTPLFNMPSSKHGAVVQTLSRWECVKAHRFGAWLQIFSAGPDSGRRKLEGRWLRVADTEEDEDLFDSVLFCMG